MSPGGIAPVPWRAEEAEQALIGHPLTDSAIGRAAVAATSGARALSQNAYKIEMVQGLLREALRGLR